MSDAIVLDKPEQINAWVILSRISQAHLHMAGYPVKGLMKWLKANVPDVTTERTVKAAYPRLLDWADTFDIAAPGGERCNYQVLVTAPKGHALHGIYIDKGVFADMAEVAEGFGPAYHAGRVSILRTMDEPRDEDSTIRMFMTP